MAQRFEQRTVLVRDRGLHDFEWDPTHEVNLRKYADEIGLRPLDLEQIAYWLREYADRLEREQGLVQGAHCPWCCMSMMHTKNCPAVKDKTP